jgi:hypothetical protein
MKINGIPVVDATKKVVIQISPKDIAKGDTKDPGACAAAQACMRQLGADMARVHIGRTYLKIGNKWTRFHTSKPLRTEIIAFDRGGKFAPGEYVLGPCQPSKRATGKRQGSRPKPRVDPKSPKRRRTYHTVANVRAHGANR